MNPTLNNSSGMTKVPEVVLPGALFLQRAEEPFDHSVLLRRVGRDELLTQPIVPACPPEAPALEDEPVVGAHDRRSTRNTQRAETFDARVFKGSFCFASSATEGELEPNDLSIVTIDDGDQVTPAISTTRDMGHVHGPAGIASHRSAHPSAHSRSRCARTLMDEPALDLEDSVDLLEVDDDAFAEAQPGPQPPVAERRKALDEAMDARREHFIHDTQTFPAAFPLANR